MVKTMGYAWNSSLSSGTNKEIAHRLTRSLHNAWNFSSQNYSTHFGWNFPVFVPLTHGVCTTLFPKMLDRHQAMSIFSSQCSSYLHKFAYNLLHKSVTFYMHIVAGLSPVLAEYCLENIAAGEMLINWLLYPPSDTTSHRTPLTTKCHAVRNKCLPRKPSGTSTTRAQLWQSFSISEDIHRVWCCCLNS